MQLFSNENHMMLNGSTVAGTLHQSYTVCHFELLEINLFSQLGMRILHILINLSE